MNKRLFILALLIVMCIMQTACSGDKEESSQEEAITNPSVDRVISDNGAEKRDGYVIYSSEYNGETYLLAVPDIYNEAAPIGAEDYTLLASDNSEDSGNASTKISEFEKSKIPEWADDKESGNGSRLIWYKYACPDFIMDTYSDDFKQMVIDGWSQWAVENGEDISESDVEYLYFNMYEDFYNDGNRIKIELYGTSASTGETEKYCEKYIDESGDYYVDSKRIMTEKGYSGLKCIVSFENGITNESAFCAVGFKLIIEDEVQYAAWRNENIERFIE